MSVATPSHAEDGVITAPAPWQLNGEGYVVAIWMSHANKTANKSETDKPEVDKLKAKPAKKLLVTLAKKAGRLRP